MFRTFMSHYAKRLDTVLNITLYVISSYHIFNIFSLHGRLNSEYVNIMAYKEGLDSLMYVELWQSLEGESESESLLLTKD